MLGSKLTRRPADCALAIANFLALPSANVGRNRPRILPPREAGLAAEEVQPFAVMQDDQWRRLHSSGRLCESGHFRWLQPALPPLS
jgi:hypothetical protein